MKVLFLTTAHKYDDDRIFYHQALELIDRGFKVKICSLCSDFQGVLEGVEIESYPILHKSSKHKTEAFVKVCNTYLPQCIIASEPLAVIAAGKFKENKNISIIYDVTEWYPSFRMLDGYSAVPKMIHKIKFTLINLYAAYVSTHFIFGEDSKKFPLTTVFPQKKTLMLPYYPDERYIHQNIKSPAANAIKLCYTGRISKEDGIGNFFSAVDALRRLKPDLEISILIIGAPKKETDKAYFADLLHSYAFENVVIEKPFNFKFFSAALADVDICFDLREKNEEYNLSLPIKIFYYIASGKPVIYTDLDAIKKHIDISKVGYLADPENSAEIARLIARYVDDPKLYDEHANNCVSLFENKYNWKLIRNSFADFIKTSSR